ncbi:pyridoxal 5'-phosphate synthase glutaminase subunit PdxT [Conservatibacter flavescens]|uniref:Pyridoxal 5'-phosphate synthase subunit PdxT n=1 Tax=Conservatibacter flavescens TaxID=28161 RepID=A0A2M8S1D4_9PAST|nr:pyridoxal 5'-phosphate synthase glutaminase subunit PdxT [Conservatibacter flavescens]PJG84969.1 pyridoxal 5'-phosphate synthase glutaminase subunit PdxT [Conservatibacter flavescens]
MNHEYSQFTVGVLALQGAVSEHLQQIEKLGAKAVAVKNCAQLNEIDAIVLPGGESTAIGKLMRNSGFIDAIRDFSQQEKPIFGTCAGMILLAKHIEGGEPSHLGLMDIVVQRNAFGRQVESFQASLSVQDWDQPFPAVFIRAPYITRFNESAVEKLAEFEGNVVLAKQGHLLACAFHPELTADLRIMRLFLEMIKSGCR